MNTRIALLVAALVVLTFLASGRGAAGEDVDEKKAAAAGFRKLSGKYITLYTDVPSSPAVDELPAVFDAAVPQWLAYFKIDAEKLADWDLNGVLIRDKAKATAAGLLTPDLPPFPNGFARKNTIWIYDQSSFYYRRHLLLHEGTHSIMYQTLGGSGPPWYAEGIAEMLATHRWEGGKLALRRFPARREDVPGLGRVELVQKAISAGKSLTLAEVLAYDAAAHRKNEPYGWSWALVAFLDGHPRYRDRLPKLLAEVGKDAESFNVAFRGVYEKDLADLMEEWQVYAAGLEYGYDFARTKLDFKPGEPLAGKREIAVKADRGWQNTGIAPESNKKYVLKASGRYQLATKPKIWWSEANGVSIRYYQGRPLGVLLAAVRPDAKREAGDSTPLVTPTTVGLGTTLAPEAAGTLFLRINDSAGELGDNAGEVRVEIAR